MIIGIFTSFFLYDNNHVKNRTTKIPKTFNISFTPAHLFSIFCLISVFLFSPRNGSPFPNAEPQKTCRLKNIEISRFPDCYPIIRFL